MHAVSTLVLSLLHIWLHLTEAALVCSANSICLLVLWERREKWEKLVGWVGKTQARTFSQVLSGKRRIFCFKKITNRFNADRGNVEHARALVKQERTSEFTHVPAATRGQQTLSEPEDVMSDECRLPPPLGLPAHKRVRSERGVDANCNNSEVWASGERSHRAAQTVYKAFSPNSDLRSPLIHVLGTFPPLV